MLLADQADLLAVGPLRSELLQPPRRDDTFTKATHELIKHLDSL